MESNFYFTQNQYGFRPERETIHIVLDAISEIEKAKKSKDISIAIFADLKKAFDTVNFEILFSKLKHYGIDDRFFRSYLSDRTQFTQIEGANSNELSIDQTWVNYVKICISIKLQLHFGSL